MWLLTQCGDVTFNYIVSQEICDIFRLPPRLATLTVVHVVGIQAAATRVVSMTETDQCHRRDETRDEDGQALRPEQR